MKSVKELWLFLLFFLSLLRISKYAFLEDANIQSIILVYKYFQSCSTMQKGREISKLCNASELSNICTTSTDLCCSHNTAQTFPLTSSVEF